MTISSRYCFVPQGVNGNVSLAAEVLYVENIIYCCVYDNQVGECLNQFVVR